MRSIVISAIFALLCLSPSHASDPGTVGWASFMAAQTAAAGCPVNAPTLPGLTCDANGWTVFTPGTTNNNNIEEGAGTSNIGNLGFNGTLAFYVDNSTGCDYNGTSCLNTGTFAAPYKTLRFAAGMMRTNEPDWLLANCTETFNETYGDVNENGGGLDKHPAVYGIYDPNNHVSPPSWPDPDAPTCSQRALISITSSSPGATGGLFGGAGFRSLKFNYTAIVGYDFYCSSRDPSSGNYLLSEGTAYGPGIGVGYTDNGALIENVRVRYCAGISVGNNAPYSLMQNLFIRRTQVVGNYGTLAGGGGAMGIAVGAMASGPSGYGLYEDIVDHNGWSSDSNATWAPRANGFVHNLYLQYFDINGDPGSLGTGWYQEGNTFAEGPTGGEQWRIGNTVAADNLFLSEPGAVVNGSNMLQNSTASWIRNVELDGGQYTNNLNGMQLEARDVQAAAFSFLSDPWTVSGNVFANSPQSVGTGDIAICMGCNSNGGTGGEENLTIGSNITYNAAIESSVGAYEGTTGQNTGSIGCNTNLTLGACAISSGGSNYTDNTVSFNNTCSSSSYANPTVAPTFQGSMAPSSVSFTATASASTTVTISGVTGYVVPLLQISGAGITSGTIILAQLTGTPGGAGTYEMSGSAQTFSGVSATQASYTIFTLSSTTQGQLQMGTMLAGNGVQSNIVASLLTGTIDANGSTYLVFGSPQTVSTQTFYTSCGTPSTVENQNYIVFDAGSPQSYLSCSSPDGTNPYDLYTCVNAFGCTGTNLGICTPAQAGMAVLGQCFYQFSTGSDTSLHGPFSCAEALGGTVNQVVIFGSTWSSSMFGQSGKIYYPWYNTTMSAGSSHCTGTMQMDLISAGNTIVGASYGGSDMMEGPGTEFGDAPGMSCHTGDTITAAANAACANRPTAASCAFSPSGTGFAMTVDYATSNTIQSTGCTPASNNVDEHNDDVNTCSFLDPARTAGSYVAANATHFSASANCTVTGSLVLNSSSGSNGGVLTVSNANSCTLTAGDALTWSGQTKAAVITGDSTHHAALCNAPNFSGGSFNCTGTGTNTGTYYIRGVTANVSGGSTFSDWTSAQLLALMDNNSRQLPWDTMRTPCEINTYIMAGFGVTDSCTP